MLISEAFSWWGMIIIIIVLPSIWYIYIWPGVTLRGQIKVQITKNCRQLCFDSFKLINVHIYMSVWTPGTLLFTFLKSLIFGLKWLLGLLGHYSRRRKFVLDFFFQSHIHSSQPSCSRLQILEAIYIYLRHKVTIYDLYELSFGIMTLKGQIKVKLKKKAHNLFTNFWIKITSRHIFLLDLISQIMVTISENSI